MTYVGAQRPGPKPRSSRHTLRPSSTNPTGGGDVSPDDRAQLDGSMPPFLNESLRPYGPYAGKGGRPTGGGDRISERHIPPHVVRGSLGAIVRAFKSSTTLRFHRMRDCDPVPLWQRNYFEHILRNAADLDHIRAYIQANPTTWDCDQANPAWNAG